MNIPEERKDERLEANLRTIVQVKESEDETWKEIVNVTGISRLGAGFDLSRPVAVGRLVALVLPMPREFRAYDLDEKAYPVMGMVQYCNESTTDGVTVYHVGVAFIGKHVPESHKADPQQSYRIAGMSEDGLWKVAEAETQFKKRGVTRYRLALEVTVSLIRREKESTDKETTFTRDISANGAAILCSLDVKVGEKIKFGCNAIDFHAFAVVRNRKETDAIPTLHVEFVDQQAPTEKIFLLHMARDAESAKRRDLT